MFLGVASSPQQFGFLSFCAHLFLLVLPYLHFFLTFYLCMCLILNLPVTLHLFICQCHSLSSLPISPLTPTLHCITGFPPLQSPILFHGNWLSMRGSHSDDEVKGGETGGRGWEEELLPESGEYLHYKRTECSEGKRYTRRLNYSASLCVNIGVEASSVSQISQVAVFCVWKKKIVQSKCDVFSQLNLPDPCQVCQCIA